VPFSPPVFAFPRRANHNSFGKQGGVGRLSESQLVANRFFARTMTNRRLSVNEAIRRAPLYGDRVCAGGIWRPPSRNYFQSLGHVVPGQVRLVHSPAARMSGQLDYFGGCSRFFRFPTMIKAGRRMNTHPRRIRRFFAESSRVQISKRITVPRTAQIAHGCDIKTLSLLLDQ
jgi:hypothetical protein